MCHGGQVMAVKYWRSSFLLRFQASEGDDGKEVEEGDGQAEQPPRALCYVAQSAAACCDSHPDDGDPQEGEGKIERGASCCQAEIVEGSFYQHDNEGGEDEEDEDFPIIFLRGFAEEGEVSFYGFYHAMSFTM